MQLSLLLCACLLVYHLSFLVSNAMYCTAVKGEEVNKQSTKHHSIHKAVLCGAACEAL